MSRRLVVAAALVMGVTSTIWSVPQAASLKPPAPTATPPDGSSYRPAINKYCVTCHNDRLKTGGLALEKVDLEHVSEGAEVWEKVIRKVRAGMMPPQGAPRLDQATADGVVSFLEKTLDRAAALKPDPGRLLLHRLNRAEYANAIRDLLDLDANVATLLPPDDSGFGFDNIGDLLGVSPVVLERYLSAGMEISRLAVGNTDIGPAESTYFAAGNQSQTQHVEGLPLGTRGGLLIHHTFPVDGEYIIKSTLWRNNFNRIRGLESPHQLEVSVDGERVDLVTIGTTEQYDVLFDDRLNIPNTAAIDKRLQVRVPVKAGTRTVGVTFIAKNAQDTQKLRPFLSPFDAVDAHGVPRIDRVAITGPYNIAGPGDTASRRRIFVCLPANAAAERPCASRILSTLARRAYRRPVNDGDIELLLSFYQSGRDKGTFDLGIEHALVRILSSPEFVFRVERSPANAAPGTASRISDIELASRLSFFLWSSIPDDRLLEVASQGLLKNPAVLARQVKRMLTDPKADSLVSNFAGQWLYLRNLKSVAPSTDEYPDFDDELRQAMRRETDLFFDSIIREDRNVLDLMTANYTFVNERLAKHYGIRNVYGSQFRRVTITDDQRRGLLGQGSILTVTSNANRTSPVKRGKWILENLLGTPPPSPPPNVPPLRENKDRDRPLTMREQMEQHRANPVCSGCHKLMDPVGFALENLDGVGAWRVRDAAGAIDSAVELADGTKVDGPAALRAWVLRRPETFVATFTEKLLTYSLGRGLTATDMPVVRSIVRNAALQDYRFSSIVMGVIKSVPFQLRVKAPHESVASSVSASPVRP